MRRAVAVLIAMLAAAMVSAQATNDLSALKFLLGDWQAIAAPGETGSFTFALRVQDHVMLRLNEAVYAATADRPASRHDDLMIIYEEKGSLKADYFDNEGHVIRYVVHPDANRRVVFVSDPSSREPRYRLTYSLGPDGLLNGSFEIAAPESPEAFKPYLTWKAKKK